MARVSETNEPHYEILLSATFWGFVDSWTEYLCLERHDNGSITLTSRSHEILAEVSEYTDDCGNKELPISINGEKVYTIDGDYVIGERLVPHDSEAEITIASGQMDVAENWLTKRKWNAETGFRNAWMQIRAAVLNAQSNRSKNLDLAPCIDSDASRRPRNDRWTKREIVIYCGGYPRPGVAWFELVFLNWNTGDFSVYARTANNCDADPESPRLIARSPNRLSWREVFKFVRKHEIAQVECGVCITTEMQGVQEWQKEVIVSGMLRLSEINPLLGALSDRDLKYLHNRLGGLLTDEARDVLSCIATHKCSRWLRRKSLTNTAKLVGAEHGGDLIHLAKKMHSYNADRAAESFLERYRELATVPPRALLDFRSLHECWCGSALMRSRLFQLWLRMEIKPRGGRLLGGWELSGSEVPTVNWLLKGHVAEVFAILLERCREGLERFVISFLQQARCHPAQHFSGSYRSYSFVTYTFGRPLFREWARLALEVQNGALHLNMDVPEHVRLPEMPLLSVNGGPAIMIMH